MAPNKTWSMDFMFDEPFNADRIRLFTLVDHFARESPAIEIDRSVSKRLEPWAYLNEVKLDIHQFVQR